MQPLALLDVTGFELVVDSCGSRHALTGHSQARGSRARYPLLEADIIALPGWLLAPAVVMAGNPQKMPDSRPGCGLSNLLPPEAERR